MREVTWTTALIWFAVLTSALSVGGAIGLLGASLVDRALGHLWT